MTDSPSAAAVRATTSMRRLGELWSDNGELVWTESRPDEDGRTAVVRRNRDGSCSDLLAAPLSARTGVYEYGGGVVAIDGDIACVALGPNGTVHRLGEAEPRPLGSPNLRHADLVIDRPRRRVVAVTEDHGEAAVVNRIGAVPLDGGPTQTLVEGADFYAAPRISPAGDRLAWITWENPQMPWDGTELWTATFDSAGQLSDALKVAGSKDESLLQPRWSPDGRLHVISDRTGWWNLYRVEGDILVPLAPMEADCAQPPWVLAQTSYGFLSDGRLAFCACYDGIWRLHVADERGAVTTVATPCTEMGSSLVCDRRRVILVGSGPDLPPSIIDVDIVDDTITVIRSGLDLRWEAAALSRAEAIRVPAADGGSVHAFLYLPISNDPPPPLLVRAHGGPTAAATTALDPRVQFWVSQGWAVVDVNYGGSTGYGRAYRNRLRGSCGVGDADDCITVARWLAGAGTVDADRMAITGGSAGGHIVLMSITRPDSPFGSAASYYGIADTIALTLTSHKFEAHYFDLLIAPLSGHHDLYRERAPLHHVANVRCPVILFQGLEDTIVPPDQAEAMAAAMRDHGVPHALITFPDEGHGFRRAENIRRALMAEYTFHCRVLGVPVVGHPEPFDMVASDKAEPSRRP